MVDLIDCYSIINKMGVFGSREEFRWGDGYELIDMDNNDKVLKLMSRVGEHEYIGKEYACQEPNEIQKMEMLIDHKILNPSPFLMRLKRAATKHKDSVCGTSKLYYLVFEKPFQTLKEECIGRRIKGDRFSQEELDCILEACVKALFYLKGIGESHRNLSTSSIFIREDRTIILGDPWVLGHPNSSNLYGFTYPSPEKILFQNHLIQSYNYLLADLFTLGVVVLECLCLEHMDGLYQKGFRRIKYTTIIEKVNMISSEKLRYKLQILLDHEPVKRGQVFRLCDRREPLRTSFVSLEKQQFKRHYVQNHLEAQETKTVKPAQEDIHTIINKINQSRDQSEFSVITEPKTHPLRPIPINFTHLTNYPQNQQNPNMPHQYNFPQTNAQAYHFRPQPYVSQPIYPPQYPLPNNLRGNPKTSNIRQQQNQTNSNYFYQNNRSIRQPEDHFQQKMSLSSIHQNSSRESEDISNIEIMAEPKKEQKKSLPSNQPSQNQQEIKQLAYYSVSDRLSTPQQNKDGPFNVRQFMRMNSTIKELSDQSPSREEIDLLTGQHQIIYQTGTRYKGNIKNGKRDGKGTFYYKDGCFYCGEWSENKMHGRGQLYSSQNKLIYDGYWYMDSFHGYGLLFNLDPTPLSLPFDCSNLIYIEDVWQEYEGDFFWDKKHGKGMLRLTNGQVFQGMFDNNQVHGEGKYLKKDGSIIKGVWEYGILIQKT